MATFTTPLDTITLDTAGDIDRQWVNSGMPDNDLRIVGHRISGNGMVTMLTIPGNFDAPCYTLSNGRYIHVSGPTLSEWQAERDAADLADTEAQARW